MSRRVLLAAVSLMLGAVACGPQLDDELAETADATDAATPLPSGGRVRNLAGARGSMHLFSVEVPEGATGLRFVMEGGTGDADLYVRFGAAPTTSAYDFRPYLGTSNEEVTVPEARVGTYYVGVHGYSAYSDVSLSTAFHTSGAEIVLQNGVSLTGLGGPRSSEIHFRLTIPPQARRLRLSTRGGAGDADLYLRRGQAPTTSSWDFRPYRSTSDETIDVDPPAPGEWFAMVRGYTEYRGVTIVAAWSSEPLGLEDEVLALMNVRRAEGASCGGRPHPPAPPLRSNELLRGVGRAHSADMADRAFFDHVNPDGWTFDRRMREGGFGGPSPWGENIAAGQSSAAEVVEGWMNSPGHCVNIMNPAFLVVGVGYHYSPSTTYRHYWTQNFAAGD